MLRLCVGPTGAGLMAAATMTHKLSLAAVQLIVTEVVVACSMLAAPRAFDMVLFQLSSWV